MSWLIMHTAAGFPRAGLALDSGSNRTNESRKRMQPQRPCVHRGDYAPHRAGESKYDY